MGWRELAFGGLDIVEVAVNPHSMLLEPYVRVLAKELKERIDRAASKPVLRTLHDEMKMQDELNLSFSS